MDLSTSFIGFRKITKKFDKIANSSSGTWFMQVVNQSDFIALDIEKLQTSIAVVYHYLRKKGGKMETEVKLTVVLDYCEDMKTYSRIGLLRS